MSDEPSRHDPLADVINVLAAPIAGGLRSVEQFQRGVGELFRAVENLNRTLENLNDTAMRVNRLVAEIEEPVRAMMPQVTRTIKAADEMTTLMQGPVRVAAPQVERIVETLSSPSFSNLPDQLGDFMQTIGDVSARLAPLTQFAENAGGLFGAFKLPGMAGGSRPAPSTAGDAAAGGTAARNAPSESTVDSSSSGMHVTMKRLPASATAEKTNSNRTAPAKQTGVKKTSAKQTGAKQTGAKQTGVKKTSAKQTGAKQTGVKKTSAKQTGVKKTSAKQTGAKRTATTRSARQTDHA